MTSFNPDDYVMLKQQTDNNLDAPARPHVLRVVEIKASGVAVLEGVDAARIEEHQKKKSRTATSPFWMGTCIRSASTKDHHFIAESTVLAGGPLRWWFVTHVIMSIICGAWTCRC